MKTVIGIDPGYDRLGWAIAQVEGTNWHSLKIDCIQTNRKQSLFQRYEQIMKDLDDIIQQYEPDEAAIESLFFFKNKKTALKVSEARGIIISQFLKNGQRISEYTPLEIKEAVTGYGRADKKAVEKMVRLEFGSFKKDIIDDAIDALAVIMTHQIRSRNIKYYA